MDILLLPEKVKTIIQLGESHFREFKSCYEGPPSNKSKRDIKDIKVDIGRTLVGFANADGGDLLIGVEDNGIITGHEYNDDQVYSLLEAPKSHVHSETPLISVVSKEIEIDGINLLFFSVQKSTKYVHLTSDGRCLQRSDKETIPVSVEQLKFERQEQISREYDRIFVDGASLSDLDQNLIENIGKIIAPGFTNEKILQVLDLAEYNTNGLRLRKSALLLFSNEIHKWHPRAEVRVLRIKGTKLKTGKDYNVVSDEIAKGNILELIENSWEKLRPHLVETKYATDALFRQRAMFPEDACREALINAIAHRDYSIEGRSVEILIFDDRMEVTSPGSLLSNIKISDLKKLQGVHQSRNSVTARVLKEVGYMREMGEGIRRIFELMKQNDLVEPELSSTKTHFKITLYNKSVFSEEDQQYVDAFNFLNLSREETLIVLLGKNGNLLSPQMIYDHLGLSDWDNYRKIIEKAQIKGLVFNALSDVKKRQLANKKRISKREIKRIKLRTPKECEDGIKQLLLTLKEIGFSSKITKEYIGNITKKLGSKTIFRFNSHLPYFKLLKLLSLTDQGNNPTILLRRLWGDKLEDETNKSKEKKEANYDRLDDEKTVYIENIDYKTKYYHLQNLFKKFGDVKRVYLPKNFKTGLGRGFAFIEMDTKENAEKAIIELNNSIFHDRIIRTNWKNI